MKKIHIGIVSILVLIFVVGGILIYLSNSNVTGRVVINTPNKEISVGSVPVIEGVVLEIAKQNGYFEEQGLDVDIIYAKSTKYLLPGLANGQLDMSIASISAGTFNYLAEDSNARIIVDVAKRKPGIIVRKDLSNKVKVMEDLNEMRFATPRLGSASYYFLAKILENSNINIEDFDMKSLKRQEAVTALVTKDLDAGIINEPFGTLAIEKNIGVFLDDKRINSAFPESGQQHSFLIATKEITDDKDTLRKFRSAYRKAASFYNKAKSGSKPERTRVIEIIFDYTDIDKDIINKSRWIYINNDAIPDKNQLEEIQDYWLRNDLINQKIDLETVIVS